MSDLDLLNQGLAGEHLGIAAYDAALGSGLLEEPTAGVGRTFSFADAASDLVVGTGASIADIRVERFSPSA
jgi:hypothetical protein